MTQEELIQATLASLRAKSDRPITRATVVAVIKAYTDELFMALVNENRVQLPDIGFLEIKKSKARVGRNPQTGKPIQIPAKNRVRIKPSIVLERVLN